MPAPDPADRLLPARLRAIAGLVRGEQRIATAVAEAIAEFLTALAGMVGVRWGVFDTERMPLARPIWTAAVASRIVPAVDDVLGARLQAVIDDWNELPAVIGYLDRTDSRIAGVADGAMQGVRNTVAAGIGAGDDIDTIAENVGAYLDPDDERWAIKTRQIARTQTLSAYNFAGQLRAEAEVRRDASLQKTWVATLDHRTRDDHWIADGQRVPVAAPFIVGGYPMMYPGDPVAPPSQRINCRCTTATLLPDEPRLGTAGRQMADPDIIEAEISARRRRGIVRGGR